MAKKKAKRSARKTAQFDPRNLRQLIDWDSFFDPKSKKLFPLDAVVEMAGWGFDPNMLLAIFITNAIIKQVKLGLDGVNHKTANPAALAEWRGLLQAAVYAHLKAGGNWSKDGANVLAVARDMGTIAGLLSGGNPEAGPNQLKSAFAATKAHTTCTGSGVGGGAWCSFDWI